ncbi:unnamed protein product [Adineta steineri]|uniref:von Willebrand factor type A domain containing protein n=2 Tax=Adineta steineri TaxID=433720 RepID=A0A815G8B8_9BILA|nr:unnamed protein product [Adineta steineri]
MLKVVSTSSRYSTERFIPLKNVAVQVNIHSFAAEVCIKQIFINSEELEAPIEAVYCFPIEEQAAIYGFEAILGDGRKIQAQIKEKKSAQREYCKALKQGHGAFLLEQDEKSNDIFTISVGSLKPQAKCEIEIRYVQELELIDDGQRIQFVLPTAIAPRYSSISAGDGHIKSPGTTTSKYVQSAPYTISFSCSIASLPIVSINSPSHPIQVTIESNDNQYPRMNASLVQENTHLDRDIILNMDLKQQEIHTYTLVEKQAIMVSLVPTLELCHTSNKMEQLNCEYIFVVDCSGSMAGENKIDYARQAMSIFIKSLPVGSYFNIFRFGSTYEQFNHNQITIEYNEESAKKATKYITNMKANLGGTELYSVLSHLQMTPPKTNYSRQIFLLTDGEIDDVDKVLRLCYSMSNTTRIFSFGLGSAPSRALVKGLARVTNGSFLFIPPNTHVDTAVARQLDKALQPCLVNLKIQCHFDNNELQNYRISPKNLPPISAKQRLNIYIMMPKCIEGTISGSIEFRTETDNILERVTFNETQPLSSLIATRLAAKSIITDLQTDDYNSKSSCQERFIEQQKADKKQELIDISIQHQILSPFTAFIGIETRTEQEIASSSGKMILREVPIEISDKKSLSIDYDAGEDDDDASADYDLSRVQEYCAITVCEEGAYSEEDVDCEEDVGYKEDVDCSEEFLETIPKSPILAEKEKFSQSEYSNSLPRDRKSRSRSRSPLLSIKRRCCKRRELSNSDDSQGLNDESLCNNQQKDDIESSDVIRQIINLQNFSGLWSINDLKQIMTLLQQSTVTTLLKNDDWEKILGDYETIDKNVILSMIIMCIFMKYFINDEPLWKPLMKKCAKAMENQLGKTEYNETTDKIKEVV